MGYEWYDDVDAIAWDFEECVEKAATAHGAMIGMAPSAGDALRSHLRAQSAGKNPLLMMDEVEKLSRDDVREITSTVAEGAMVHASERGSRHVTREDVESALKGAAYPYSPR